VPGANSNGVLAHSYFGVFNDSLKIRSVRFDSLIFCLNYLPASATSAITPSSQCGADILSRYMRDSTPPQLRIVPNPAGSEIAIISSADLGEVTIGIYDMLGIEQRKMTVILEKNIPRRLGLSIPSGIYNLHLKSAAYSYDLRVAVNK